MSFIIKYFYIILFVTLFLLSTVLDYFRNGNTSLLENALYAFWIVIFLAMVRLLLKSKKSETKKI